MTEITVGVASGLARLHLDLAAGKSMGLIPVHDLDRTALISLISRLRGHGCGYGVIKATGRTAWLIVRHGRLADLKTIGGEFKRHMIIHVPEGGKKPALRHNLETGDHEALGPGAKVLDDLDIYELLAPPGGMFNRSWRPYEGDLPPTLYCSFCGLSQHEVRKLVAGPTVFICDLCIELCVDIIRLGVDGEAEYASWFDGASLTRQIIIRQLHERFLPDYLGITREIVAGIDDD